MAYKNNGLPPGGKIGLRRKMRNFAGMIFSKLAIPGVLLLCFLLFPPYIKAQDELLPQKHYPQGYFIYPVDARVGLAANFGELRRNHFHMGLDCRTDQQENKRVFAAADGYISRIKIEPFGFGRSISINHPNGLTTLYAHLNEFDPRIEKYLKTIQYEQKTWSITLPVPEGVLPVKKGEFIAYSGNTGGSMGPHLHFEIRDTKTEKVLNPLLFGFPIQDNIPPSILRLAVYDRRVSTYDYPPKLYPVKLINGKYQTLPSKIMVSSDEVSFAITAYDHYTGSTNQNGIYEAEIFEDGKPLCGFQLDSISYDETRYLNAHIDYRTKANGGPYLQHLSQLPGYHDGVYHSNPGNGVIGLIDEAEHEISIKVYDTNGNERTLSFILQKTGKTASLPKIPGQVFRPNEVNIFENENVLLYLPENALYDSFHFRFSEIKTQPQPTYSLHNPSVPVHVYFPVMIKPGLAFNDTSKLVMKRYYGSKEDFKKADYVNGWYRAWFRELGNFQLIYDDIPPVITPVGFQNGMNTARLHSIRFRVKDNTEEIPSFEAYLDGQWLRFSNDKAKDYIYTFDEKCPPGKHLLRVVVKDLAGNTTEKSYQFTR